VLFFACPQANLFDSLLFTRSGCLALLCCMHVLSLARTLVLSRSSSRARTHSRARNCWQASVSFCLLYMRVPLFAGWPEIVSSYLLTDECLFLREQLAIVSSCLLLTSDFFFLFNTSVFFCLQAGESFGQSLSLSNTSSPFLPFAYSLTVCVVIIFRTC